MVSTMFGVKTGCHESTQKGPVGGDGRPAGHPEVRSEAIGLGMEKRTGI